MEAIIHYKALCYKEIARFLKVFGQTVFGPLINASLFLFVFMIAIPRDVLGDDVEFSYMQFLLPGLIMMAVIQNAFANTSSSLLVAKMTGVVVDLLMAPINTHIIILSYITGAFVRALLVSLSIAIYMTLFVDYHIQHIFWCIYFLFFTSMCLGLMGIIAAIVAKKFDQLANFTNLIITPLSFLSGTFYKIDRLPDTLQHFAMYNPFFHMIDGFRYSFLGIQDGNVLIGAIYLLLINVILYLMVYWMWSKGYRIKE